MAANVKPEILDRACAFYTDKRHVMWDGIAEYLPAAVRRSDLADPGLADRDLCRQGGGAAHDDHHSEQTL